VVFLCIVKLVEFVDAVAATTGAGAILFLFSCISDLAIF